MKLKYYLDQDCEKLFGVNFSLLMKLAVMADPELKKKSEITFEMMEDSFFQHKGTGKRNLIVYFSNNEDLRKYIRLSYVGNYYFGFKISSKQYLKTFLANQNHGKGSEVNKYLYTYLMKHSFKNNYHKSKVIEVVKKILLYD